MVGLIVFLSFVFVFLLAAFAGITGIGAVDTRDASWGITPRGNNQDMGPVRFTA